MLRKRLTFVQQKKKVLLLTFFFFLTTLAPFAQQQITVHGSVFTEDNNPLAGVSVTVKGGFSGTTTNAAGKFTIQVNKGATVVFSYIGYLNLEVQVRNNPIINVTLISKSSQLDDVVVVGYGSTRKSDLTGSVSSISKEKLEKVPTATFDLKLQGRVSGVNVTQTSSEPGGNVSVRIRGSNSISAGNEPLYVVDGYPLPSGGEATGNGYGQPSNALSAINPNDIESIQVLKDASATAIYGARGSNGVIIITTKRGAAGAPRVEYTSRIGTTNVINIYKMMIARDYAQVRNDFAVSLGTPIPYNGSSAKNPTPEQAGVGTNWVNEILRSGVSQSHQLNISGGSGTLKYNISGNYYLEGGVIKNSDYKRGNLRVNIDNKISNKITLNTTLNLTNSSYQRVQSGTGAILTTADPINLALRSNPIFPKDATLTGEFGGIINAEDGYFNNPITVITDKKDQTQNEDYFASLLGVYQITKELGLNVRGGATRRYSMREIYFPITTGQGFQTNGDAYSNKFSYKDYIFESFLKFRKTLNKNHKIDLTGGFSYQTNTSQTNNIRVTTFPNDILSFDALQFGTGYYPTISSKILRTLQSFYVRTNYDLLDRYLFTFTGRADGSSVFAINNKWGYFPSGAIAWKVSQEPFFPKNNIISDIKLRASYGIVGNQAISPLGSLARLNVANYNINDQIVSGIASISLSNPDLKWETTKQVDIGGDFAFIKGKVNLTVDVYKKTTNDLLQLVQLPYSTGFSNAIANIGTIENKGLEIELSGEILTGKTFNWSSAFNISFNRSKILDLGVKNEILGPGPGTNYLSAPSNIMRVGQPFAMFYGLTALRLIQPSDFDATTGRPTFATFNGEKNSGQWLYEDLNKDGIINNNDRQIIGNPNPDFIFGFNNNFKYKNLQLSVFIQGVYGNQVMNLNNAFIRTGYPFGNKTEEWFKNRWTPDNPTNDIRYPAFGTIQASLVSGNYYLEDASYVRLKNVTLTYNLSKVGKLIKNASVYLSGTNLITITNYSGFDPEVGIYGQNNQIPGIDFGGYPRSRIIDLGLKLIF